ncbi:hypothetical protein GCM10010400_24230 [Streptomyces aculeolatus]|uniref:hypothetical protein n=1 Tax=Streptomyces aculeolatus TaxID=270689 RepID=UPI001CED870B|nr:hypothetical protein [Streptomyces aculeolatus]
MDETAAGREQARGERRAERLLRRARGPREVSARARRAWRRLTDEALRGEPGALAVLSRVAREPEHPRTHQARTVVADRWAATDDPGLRQTVLDTRALATPHSFARLRTAALHGPEQLRATGRDWAAHAPALLADHDNDVRKAVTELCRTADTWATNRLWPQSVSRGAPDVGPLVTDERLFDILLTCPSVPPPIELDMLWKGFLQRIPAGGLPARAPRRRLLPALTGWGREAPSPDRRALSRVVVEPDTARLLAHDGTRQALIEAAGYADDHPLAAVARERILALRERSPAPRRVEDDSDLGVLSDLADFVDELCAYALEPRRDLLRWCVTHHLAPSHRDPARRAAFLLHTDQPPDIQARTARWTAGPGLAQMVLGAADGEERARRVDGLTDAELTHLAGWLDDEDRLADLWQLVRDLPLARGHRLVPLLAARQAADTPPADATGRTPRDRPDPRDGAASHPRDAWRPGDEAGRRLLALLRGIDPGTLAAGLAALERDWPAGYHLARIRFRGRVNDLSFAPDAPLLAVATSNRAAGVIDLHRGELAERYDGFASSVGHLAHLGGEAFVAAERTSTAFQPSRLLHCAGGRSRVLRELPGAVTSLEAWGAGRFVAGTRSGHLLFGGPADAGAGEGADGGVEDGLPLPEPSEVSVAAWGLDPGADWPRALAADAYTGRLAVCGRRLLLVELNGDRDRDRGADADAAQGTAAGPESVTGPRPGAIPTPRVLARGTRPRVTTRAVLAGPAALAVHEQRRGVVEVLRPEVGALPSAGSVDGVTAMTALPGRGQLAIVDDDWRLRLLDAATLAPRPGVMPEPPASPSRYMLGPVTSLHASPDGGLLAAGYAGGITDLYDLRHAEIPSLATRPLAYARPAHVDALLAALDAPGLTRPVREVLRLLLAQVSYRCPRDGDAATLSTGGYDIAL